MIEHVDVLAVFGEMPSPDTQALLVAAKFRHVTGLPFDDGSMPLAPLFDSHGGIKMALPHQGHKVQKRRPVFIFSLPSAQSLIPVGSCIEPSPSGLVRVPGESPQSL